LAFSWATSYVHRANGIFVDPAVDFFTALAKSLPPGGMPHHEQSIRAALKVAFNGPEQS